MKAHIMTQHEIDKLLDYNPPRVIALCGLARSGKDTIAEYLVNTHGYTRVAYADIMKDMLCDTFNIYREELDAFKNDSNSTIAVLDVNQSADFVKYNLLKVTFRNILENFGQMMKKHFGENVWSALLIDKINAEVINGNTKIVISDLRFLIEYTDLRGTFMDLHIMEVNRGLKPSTQHPAENEYLSIPKDLIVDNTKDVVNSYSQVLTYLESLKTRKDAQ